MHIDSYNENKIWIKNSKDVAHPEKEVCKSGRLIFLTLLMTMEQLVIHSGRL